MQWINLLAAYDPDPGGEFATRQGIISLVVIGLLVGVPAFLIIYMRQKNKGRPLGMPNMTPPPEYRATMEQDTRPGRYKVFGVLQTTKADTAWETRAESSENARVKAELEGIIVTRVERTGN